MRIYFAGEEDDAVLRVQHRRPRSGDPQTIAESRSGLRRDRRMRKLPPSLWDSLLPLVLLLPRTQVCEGWCCGYWHRPHFDGVSRRLTTSTATAVAGDARSGGNTAAFASVSLPSPWDVADESSVELESLQERGASSSLGKGGGRIHENYSVSRRDWFGLGILAAAAGAAILQPLPAAAQTTPAPVATSPVAKPPAPAPSKPMSPANKTCSIEVSDIKGIASKVDINVTSVIKTNEGILPQTTCESIDRSTYTKVKKVDAPWFIPEALRPKVVKKIPNSQLLLAGIVAGSITEIARVSLLYPLDTVKNRIQADPRHRRARTLRRKVQLLGLSFLKKWRDGDLYAGLLPAVLVSVPASGVYCGIRDVTKRVAGEAAVAALLPQGAGPVVVSLFGAIVADVASLVVRTPADVLALRLQVGKEAEEADLLEALGDGLARLPAVIVTDLPYLLSRIALNYAVLTGAEGLGRYQVETVAIACGCAFLTTPFDVARTRILVDDKKLGKEEVRTQLNSTYYFIDLVEEIPVKRRSKRRDGVLYTMAKVAREGDGGVQNLFAGAIERTAYNGIVRAWLDPIRLIGYMGIRDAILLRWFE